MGDSLLPVLVVDDERVICDFLSRLLRFRDLMVESAESAKDALSLAQKKRYGIIFLDVRMPEMDGLELLRHLKGLQPDAVYIMMTGYAVEHILQEAMQEGAMCALRKPFDIAKVQEALQQALNKISA